MSHCASYVQADNEKMCSKIIILKIILFCLIRVWDLIWVKMPTIVNIISVQDEKCFPERIKENIITHLLKLCVVIRITTIKCYIYWDWLINWRMTSTRLILHLTMGLNILQYSHLICCPPRCLLAMPKYLKGM